MSSDPVDAPIEGQVLLVASAKASVPGSELPGIVGRVQAHLGEHVDDYENRYERVHADPPDRYYLVPTEHWRDLGRELGLSEAELDAARRAHEQQLLRLGRRTDRREEFESALEIREAVVIRDPDDARSGVDG